MDAKQLEAAGWGRRVRVLAVQPSMLLELVRRPDQRARLTSAGLPDDARFVAAYYDDAGGWFRIHVESAAFDFVPEGARIPELTVVFTAHYPGEGA